jgi:hypothetical protein
MMTQMNSHSNEVMRAMADSDEHALQRSRHPISVRLPPDQYWAHAAEAGKYGISIAAAATIRMFRDCRPITTAPRSPFLFQCPRGTVLIDMVPAALVVSEFGTKRRQWSKRRR